jgi:hypothetical protein
MEDHVTKFAFVHELTAFWTLEEVFFFVRRNLFVFVVTRLGGLL